MTMFRKNHRHLKTLESVKFHQESGRSFLDLRRNINIMISSTLQNGMMACSKTMLAYHYILHTHAIALGKNIKQRH